MREGGRGLAWLRRVAAAALSLTALYVWRGALPSPVLLFGFLAGRAQKSAAPVEVQCNNTAWLDLDPDTRPDWPDCFDGFRYRVTGTMGEWVASIALLAFFLSYTRECVGAGTMHGRHRGEGLVLTAPCLFPLFPPAQIRPLHVGGLGVYPPAPGGRPPRGRQGPPPITLPQGRGARGCHLLFCPLARARADRGAAHLGQPVTLAIFTC